MAEDSGQERTQEATPRRKQQARERGQVAQSRELNTMLMLLSAGLAAAMVGPYTVRRILDIIRTYFSVDRNAIYDTAALPQHFSNAVVDALFAISPFFIILTIAAIAGPILMGGFNFSGKAVSFKFEKLDPVKGMQRIFAWRGLIELLKALLKFVFIGTVAIIFLYGKSDSYIGLGYETLQSAIAHTSNLLIWGFITISATMVIIAIADVPFQLWDHNQQLKMTHQEVRDDNKDTEGDPELRGRIRRQQREIAQRRMMAEVPKADVVITNPEHYSVALKYDQLSMGAPIVVAKGVDIIAMQIRKIAKEYDVMIVEAPPLARALHHTTELNAEVPAGLYLAVAKVLAYVFQLKQRSGANTQRSARLDDLPIPDDMKYDE
ncbi:MAG: flagellar biosynthesis protein FlhB [Thioalkalispiraceae bacterium]|jgi:flagellar biosynthetic protein FlhB